MQKIAIGFVLLAVLLSSCSVVEGIFKAGVWVGILSVVAVIVLLIYLFSKLSGKK